MLYSLKNGEGREPVLVLATAPISLRFPAFII
jgi:hypothetical protein